MLTKKQKALADKAKEELTVLADYLDYEVAHEKADECLCELLINLGMNEVVEAFSKVTKVYA